VARRAGITRPIVYGHFGDLPGLLEALIEREAARALAQLAAILPTGTGGDPRDQLFAAMEGYLRAAQADPVTWRLVLMPPEGAPALLRDHIGRGREGIVAALADAVGPGVGTPDPELFARMLSALSDEAVRLLLTDPERYNAERFARPHPLAAGPHDGMTAFVTGFPGFIGRRLVRRLAADGRRVVVLVERRMEDRAREIAPAYGEGIEVVRGDIAERRLGLDVATWERLTAEVTRVYHLAAIYDLAVPVDIAQRVNVGGTGNVLELCLAAPNLERLAYVSTAYVAGLRTGIVYEHELVMGQAFKNHYESTKFQAEVWVRELMDSIPTTILRPAIVVGDSRTGETEKFDGPYYILRTISTAQRMHRPVMQFGRSEATFNVVPVDYVVDAVAAVAHLPETLGETLHLVDADALSTRELVTLLSREYARREPRGRLSPRLVQRALRAKPCARCSAARRRSRSPTSTTR